MQTSKQYHSLALWVIMLISLSLLSACGGGSGGGSGDSNLDGQALFGNALPDSKTITIDNNKFKLDPNSFSSGVTLNTENQPTEWMKDVNFGINQNTQKRTLTIAGLYQTENDKYSSAKVTENGQQVGEGLIRETGEALFVLDFITGSSPGLILGNAIVLDPLNLGNYEGGYGCATPGCKDALALGYLYEDGDKKFYHDVKLKINVEKEGNNLKAFVPAWFVSDRLNSAEFTALDEVSEEFSKNENDEFFYINYFGDPNPDNGVDESLDIYINGRLFAGSTDDVFIAGRYNFFYFYGEEEDESLRYYGVFALEKTN